MNLSEFGKIELRLHDRMRSLFGVRVKRRRPPAGPRPMPGATIARGEVAMKILNPMPEDIWQWLSMIGWRQLNLNKERRRYRVLPSKSFSKLLEVKTNDEREKIVAQMLKDAQKLELEKLGHGGH